MRVDTCTRSVPLAARVPRHPTSAVHTAAYASTILVATWQLDPRRVAASSRYSTPLVDGSLTSIAPRTGFGDRAARPSTPTASFTLPTWATTASRNFHTFKNEQSFLMLVVTCECSHIDNVQYSNHVYF